MTNRQHVAIDNHPLSVGNGSHTDCDAADAVQSIADGPAVQSVALSPAVQLATTSSLPLSVARFLRVSTAPATRRAYQGDVSDFLKWGGRVPCDSMMLARYIAERADCHRPSTVARRVVGIGRAHVAYGLPDPSKDELVRAVLRGVRRELGTAQRRAAPLLRDDLLAVLERLPADLRGVRDRALLLLGFAGGLRRSEIVQLDADDLSYVPDGMNVRLRHSKTDQDGAGRTIAGPYGRTAACPVRAVRDWLDVSQIQVGPVFRGIGRCGVVSASRLSDQVVSLVVKAQMAALGRAPDAYSGHSLRAGFVTSAAQAGAGYLMIQQQTGHRSVAMLNRYVRVANLFEGNAAGVLL